jgi:CBS domain-containing protein
MRDIAINRIMTPNPICVRPHDTVESARKILRSQDIHHLPVVEDGVLVGIFSASDLFKLYPFKDRQSAFDATRVSQVMDPEPVTLDVFSDLIKVATVLNTGSFHALPVVESENVLVGIVTTTDLINHLLMQIPRGDGSDTEENDRRRAARVTDADLVSTMRLARATLESGKPSKMAEVVIFLREQNRLLKVVCKAAEHYMRSGHAEREHSVLMKALDEVERYGTG